MFSPLGRFDVSLPVSPAMLAAVRTLTAQLPDVPKGDLTRVYLHWSVAKPCAQFPDYNIMVNFADGHYTYHVSHDLKDNARSTFAASYATHTYHRNRGAVGICLGGMDGATEQNYGPDPITLTGLDFLCAAAAAVCKKYDIDASGLSADKESYDNEHTILTHAEAAMLVGNPPQYSDYGISGDSERWDLASFVPLPSGVALTPAMARSCGDALRARIHALKVAL